MRSDTERPASAEVLEAPVIVCIQSSSNGCWDVTTVGAQRPISCETLDDARCVAYLTIAHGHRCELIVRDTQHHVLHRELIQARRETPTGPPRADGDQPGTRRQSWRRRKLSRALRQEEAPEHERRCAAARTGAPPRLRRSSRFSSEAGQ